MPRYLINMFALVDTKDYGEAEKIAQEIVNADLPKEATSKLEKFSYNDPYSDKPDIHSLRDTGWG